MVKIEKIQAGLARYADAELLPNLDGWKRIGAGAGIALAIKNMPSTLSALSSHPFFSALGLVRENGEIDIDSLYNAISENFVSESETVNIPLVGRMTLTRDDISKIYQFIKEG